MTRWIQAVPVQFFFALVTIGSIAALVAGMVNVGDHSTVSQALLWGGVSGVAVGCFFAFVSLYRIAGEAGASFDELNRLVEASGRLDFADADNPAAIGLHRALLEMRAEQKRYLDDSHRRAEVNRRIREALDRVKSNVVLTDVNGR